MLKAIIQRSAPMHMFVRKFLELQIDRNEQEDKENHIIKKSVFAVNIINNVECICRSTLITLLWLVLQMQRKKRIGVPIERHAEAIYTRAMHEKFYNELYESGAYAIKDREGEDRFVLMHTKAMFSWPPIWRRRNSVTL